VAKQKEVALESEMEGYILQAWNSGVKFTLKEVYEKVKRRLTATPGINLSDPACQRHSLILVGEAGCGKSTVLEDLCREIGAEYQTYHHGATVVEDNHGLQKADDAEGLTKHVLAAHMIPFHREPKGGMGVFLIDEANNGAFSEHEVVLRMLIDGQCDEHKVKPGWLFVCASNPPLAKYGTVRQIDFSLEDRFIVMPVAVPTDDKLAYWANHMPTTVYTFLALNRFGNEHNDYINAISSRRWSTLAYDIEKDLRAGASHADVVKFLKCNVNTSIAEAFDAFLKLGTNPDNYPIRAKELIEADASGSRILKERVNRWLTAKKTNGDESPNVPLLGATKFDICAYLNDARQRDAMKDGELDNLGGFLVQIGTKGFADMVDDIFHTVAQTPMAQKLLKRIRGTPLEDRMISLFKGTINTGVQLTTPGRKK
jgi:hypothetical protein